jgi:hypothetical protein
MSMTPRDYRECRSRQNEFATHNRPISGHVAETELERDLWLGLLDFLLRLGCHG